MYEQSAEEKEVTTLVGRKLISTGKLEKKISIKVQLFWG
jgi:hypothetical protein